jgi:transcriptional regulator with XRE-family HTH domain
MDINQVIGRNISKARQKAGISIEKLALAVKITVERLKKIEEGKEEIHVAFLYDVAEALNIMPSELLKEKEDKHFKSEKKHYLM